MLWRCDELQTIGQRIAPIRIDKDTVRQVNRCLRALRGYQSTHRMVNNRCVIGIADRHIKFFECTQALAVSARHADTDDA